MSTINSLNEDIKAYHDQLKDGTIQQAYNGLIKYMMSLRNSFAKRYAEEFVVGNFYQGYMDYTYFSITPNALKSRKLKIVINLDHQKMQFEIYLVGQNKQIIKEYLVLFVDNKWDKYHISSDRQDAILDEVLVASPDFSDLDALNIEIEEKVNKFIDYIIALLA